MLNFVTDEDDGEEEEEIENCSMQDARSVISNPVNNLLQKPVSQHPPAVVAPSNATAGVPIFMLSFKDVEDSIRPFSSTDPHTQ